jgi:hypothetical protein
MGVVGGIFGAQAYSRLCWPEGFHNVPLYVIGYLFRGLLWIRVAQGVFDLFFLFGCSPITFAYA